MNCSNFRKKISFQVPAQQRQSNKGVPGLADAATLVNEEEAESQEDSDDDSYESETSDSEAEYGYTMATKEEYEPPIEVKKKTKTKGGKQGIVEDAEMENETDETSVTTKTETASDWTQIQQKELEQAIKTFPKGTEERWDRIASKVGGKSKEECLLRFKYLATMVKNKKAESPS